MHFYGCPKLIQIDGLLTTEDSSLKVLLDNQNQSNFYGGKKMNKFIWFLLGCSVLGAMPVLAECPSMDFTGDCRVDLADFAVFVGQWMTEGSYTLHVDSSGALEVSISSSTGHDGTTKYTQMISVGTTVTLTAPFTAGSELFIGWTGDITSNDQTISFSMNADKTVTANYIPMPDDLVIIHAGTFQMGNSTNVGEGYSNELPVHTVTLDSFCMGKYEVNNGQYCAFLNSAYPTQLKVINGVVYAPRDTECRFPFCDTSAFSSNSQIVFSNDSFRVRTKGGRDMTKDPMVQVSWYGAVAYCNWRSQQEGREPCYDISNWACDFTKNGYRLPTEAEWEYAARGGLSGNRFPWGNTITHSQANYDGDSRLLYDVSPTRGYHPTWNDGLIPYTSPNGNFASTGFDLYDMSGNVWEWCNDWYSESYYSSSPINNPIGPTTGSRHVLRGGSWGSWARACRVSHRDRLNPDFRDGYQGFRVTLDLN